MSERTPFTFALQIFLIVNIFNFIANARDTPGFKNVTVDAQLLNKKPIVYRANWGTKARWIGRAWWANPLWDWRCTGNGVVRAPASGNYALALLPFELTTNGDSFIIRTTVKFLKNSKIPYVPRNLGAGFGLGRKAAFDDHRAAAVYGLSQVTAVLNSNGFLSISGKKSSKSVSDKLAATTLTLKGTRVKNSVLLLLTATQAKSKITVFSRVPLAKVTGMFALITEGPRKRGAVPADLDVAFQQFSISGSMLKRFNGRMYGAIMWSQYTVSKKTLRLQAQLAPVDKPLEVKLVIRDSPGGKVILTKSSMSDRMSRTAQFTAKNWDSQRSWAYDVLVQIKDETHKWSGSIQKEPPVKLPLKIAVFSCDKGYTFPQQSMVSQVERQNPHLMYFAGDQMYWTTGGFAVPYDSPVEISMLDFLLRWYLFGWTWRNLLAKTPSVIIPDDHDVFQGNLFGNGGVALKIRGEIDLNAGGYLMPGKWVSAVERCHTGHLPPSRANFKTPLGLKPYFTSLIYGGLSMAVLEDRKFKSAPLDFPISTRRRANGNLLGSRQELFLKKWVNEWEGVSMKVAFSQTIFCAASTHNSETLRPGRGDYDSNAWPIDARNRAVRLLGKGNVLSLHGDQHLGMLMRHGVDKHDDANVAFMVPGTANGFPRAWWPGVSRVEDYVEKSFTGRFIDAFGHPITVLAVANPQPKPRSLEDEKKIPPLQLAYKKGSGYGLVIVNRVSKTAKFNMYRVGGNFEQFKGFPKRIYIGGKPTTPNS